MTVVSLACGGSGRPCLGSCGVILAGLVVAVEGIGCADGSGEPCVGSSELTLNGWHWPSLCVW